MIQALPPQAVVETKVQPVTKVGRVIKVLKVGRGPKGLPVVGVILQQAVVVTKVQLVIKDLLVELQVLAL